MESEYGLPSTGAVSQPYVGTAVTRKLEECNVATNQQRLYRGRWKPKLLEIDLARFIN